MVIRMCIGLIATVIALLPCWSFAQCGCKGAAYSVCVADQWQAGFAFNSAGTKLAYFVPIPSVTTAQGGAGTYYHYMCFCVNAGGYGACSQRRAETEGEDVWSQVGGCVWWTDPETLQKQCRDPFDECLTNPPNP